MIVDINPVIRITENAFKNEKSFSFCSLYTLMTSNSTKDVITKLKRINMGLVCRLNMDKVKK